MKNKLSFQIWGHECCIFEYKLYSNKLILLLTCQTSLIYFITNWSSLKRRKVLVADYKNKTTRDVTPSGLMDRYKYFGRTDASIKKKYLKVFNSIRTISAVYICVYVGLCIHVCDKHCPRRFSSTDQSKNFGLLAVWHWLMRNTEEHIRIFLSSDLHRVN